MPNLLFRPGGHNGAAVGLADEVVLALPSRIPIAVAVTGVADGDQFRIVEVLKGSGVVNGIIPGPVRQVDAAAIRSGKPFLLLRNKFAHEWASAGTIGAEYAGWLRQLTATSYQSELTDLDWRARVALVLPYLENPEPLAAEIAHGEFVLAPYRVQRSAKPHLDATTIIGWIDDPKLAPRRSTYTLLLGITGAPDDAARLEQRIDTGWTSHDVTNLAAMLAADLELRGPSRVDWIETMYFADRNRTLPEIEAALLALSVHGDANAAVPRERVIQAYRFFMRAHEPMAGFVALELAGWEYWDVTPEYVALLKSNAIKDPGSRYAVLTYLHRSPQAAAKTALQSLDDEPR